jgi:putative transposase
LPVRRTLEKVGIPRATFYRWYDLYQAGGPEALDDRHPKPDRVWNRIPDDVRERIIKLALEEVHLVAEGIGRAVSPTPKAILSRRLRSIGCSRSTI